jgi:hypothetical protein
MTITTKIECQLKALSNIPPIVGETAGPIARIKPIRFMMRAEL